MKFMMSLNRFLFFVILSTVFVLILSCSTDEQIEFTITNSSEIDRTDEPVVLTRSMIIEKTQDGSVSENRLPLPHLGEDPLPAQPDDMTGDGSWNELAFTIDLTAGESKTVTLRFVGEGDYPEFTQRTSVRFGVKDNSVISNRTELNIPAAELPVPPFGRFQMDGPAWENDKIGFRQYIDGRNGRDLFGKTSSEMALDTVGISPTGDLEDNYHVMLPWGRDILAVGNSLGLGGLAIMENGDPVRLGIRMDETSDHNVDMTSYQLITEGPVRSIFNLSYEGWNTGDHSYDLENRVTIWAGQYGHYNNVTLKSSQTSDTLVVGLVNIHNDQPEQLIDNSGTRYSALYTLDQQTYDKEWYLGIGLIFPSEPFIDYSTAPESGSGITNSYLAQFNLEEDNILRYYVTAGWELSNSDFTDPDYFRSFMERKLQTMSAPLTIE